MTCRPCVDKLASRLIVHHGKQLDLIRAYELAEKAVERYERNKPVPVVFEGVRSLTREEKVKLDFDPDYSQACSPSGSCTCYGTNMPCTMNPECLNPNDTCACSCPAPSKAHSHYVNNTCSPTKTYSCACNQSTLRCYSGRTCSCRCSGYCYYTCDEGYVWNPTSQQCEPVATSPRAQIDGLTCIISRISS